jgi:hypothetical protein
MGMWETGGRDLTNGKNAAAKSTGDGDNPMTLYGTADWKAVLSGNSKVGQELIRDDVTVTVVPAGYTPEAAIPKLRRPTPTPPCSCDLLLAVVFHSPSIRETYEKMLMVLWLLTFRGVLLVSRVLETTTRLFTLSNDVEEALLAENIR